MLLVRGFSTEIDGSWSPLELSESIASRRSSATNSSSSFQTLWSQSPTRTLVGGDLNGSKWIWNLFLKFTCMRHFRVKAIYYFELIKLWVVYHTKLESLCLLVTVINNKKNGLMRNLRKDLLLLGISQDEFHFKYSKEKGDVERMIMTSAYFYTHLKYMGVWD